MKVEPSTYDVVDVVGGKSHGYDHDVKDEVYYSAVKVPSTSTGEGKGFTLSNYGPVSTPAPRGEKEEDEYEVVQTTSNV